MPELYTFVTERTDDLNLLEDIKANLEDYKICFEQHELDGFYKKYYYLSGYHWEEDCGYPIELSIVFDKSGLNCVYCNNNEYGVLKGNEMRLNNSTSKSAEHI